MSGAGAARRLLGTAGGVGLLPGAPGTWGSLATVLAAAALVGVRGAFDGPLAPAGPALLPGALGLAAGLCALGLWAGTDAERHFGAHDPSHFVLDEVVGQLLALLPLLAWGPGSPPADAASVTGASGSQLAAAGAGLPPLGLLIAFALFRLFDISKPPPVSTLERLPGGFGIMADDVAAGILAAGGLALLARLDPAVVAVAGLSAGPGALAGAACSGTIDLMRCTVPGAVRPPWAW